MGYQFGGVGRYCLLHDYRVCVFVMRPDWIDLPWRCKIRSCRPNTPVGSLLKLEVTEKKNKPSLKLVERTLECPVCHRTRKIYGELNGMESGEERPIP